MALVYHLAGQEPPAAEPTDPRGPRVLLVDPHLGIRATIAELLTEHDIQVVGAAADGDTALALARTHQPTVVLLEVRLGGNGSGLALIDALKEAAPGAQILIFTILDSLALADAATKAGAYALVTKGVNSATLIRIIHEAQSPR